MIPLPFLSGKHVAVIGLGKAGAAAVTALEKSGATCLIWDDKTHRDDPLEGWDWNAIDLLLLSPGVPYTHPAPHAAVLIAQQHGVEIVGEVELLYRACPDATFIGITGTNGKSTTTSLIGHMLTEAGMTVEVGGNLGVAALALNPLGKKGIYVLELSSYQLDLVRSVRFDIAVLLNFSPDHLDRHGDMAGYIAAKSHIFDRQTSDDVAIIGVDDAYSEALARQLIGNKAQRVIPIATTQQCGNGIWVKGGMLHNPLTAAAAEYDLRDLSRLRGEHNHQNIAAAYAVGVVLGLEEKVMQQAIASFPGLAHRMELVAQQDGVRYVNDSKATNADAAAKSLAAYERIYWIAGGVAKAGGIEPLAPYFPKIAHAFLIGEAAEAFASTLEGHVAYTQCGTLERAIDSAMAQIAQDGLSDATILLAPACASFDQYANFEQRGERFAAYVKERLAARDMKERAIGV